MPQVETTMNYALPGDAMPRFHANDHGLDTVPLDTRPVSVADMRNAPNPPSLDEQGGALFDLPTAVSDFRRDEEVAKRYPAEVSTFIQRLTEADAVVVAGPPTLRFSARSTEAGSRDNSDAARLVHSDTSDAAALAFAEQSNPHRDRTAVRIAQHNVWRSFSGAPQDMPLALCDYRSVPRSDIVPAEAAFDRDGVVEWAFEAMLFRYNPDHRWYYYSDMTPDEVLVFKRHDTDAAVPQYVPHSAFEMPGVDDGTAPRASVELRTIAYWYE